MGSSSYWGYQIESLARSHAVIVMDTRGHGRSPVTSSAFGYELFADDVVALMDSLLLQCIACRLERRSRHRFTRCHAPARPRRAPVHLRRQLQR